MSLFYQPPSPHFISPSPTFFLSRLSIHPKSVTFMKRVSVFVRNIFIYALFAVFLSGALMRLSSTPPTRVLRWRYQYPCHQSDTAHAISINILQSPILLHLNYLSCMIRLYILSKPNPKWGIWLLVCLSWIFKSSIQKGLKSTNLACSGTVIREEAVLE